MRNAPVVQQFATAHNIPLLIIRVGDRTTWKSPSHPLRSDPVLPVNSVPTAATWIAPGKPAAVAGSALERATTDADVHTLLQELLQQS